MESLLRSVRPAFFDRFLRDAGGRWFPQRLAYVLLRKYVRAFFDSPVPPYRMLALHGLRGTGKTVLLWQTLRYIYRNYQKKHVFFANGDSIRAHGYTLLDVIGYVESEIFRTPLESVRQPFVIAVDEIHVLEHWQQHLKILHDRAPRALILVTGSSALHLRSTPDLVTRWKLLPIFPLSFPEYVMLYTWFEGKEPLTPPPNLMAEFRQTLLNSLSYGDMAGKLHGLQSVVEDYFARVQQLTGETLQEVVERYVAYYHIPRFLPRSPEDALESAWEMLTRILSEDLGLPLTGNVWRFLMHLAGGEVVSLLSLSQTLGVQRNDLEAWTSGLVQAGAIYALEPFGGPGKKAHYRKVVFSSPALRLSIFSRMYGPEGKHTAFPRLLEDMVGALLIKRAGEAVSFPDGKAEIRPDFVVSLDKQPWLIEVGTGKKAARQIVDYARKTGISYRYGVVVSPRFQHPDWNERHRILYLPLSWFLLL